MKNNEVPVSNGLEGVVVAETRLSDVDGERGRLVIAGHDVESIALEVPFERVAAALWSGEADDVHRALGEGRVAAFALLPSLGRALELDDGMDALRASMAQLPARFATPAMLTGAMAVFACAWMRARECAVAIAPDASLPHAADVLRMIRGVHPSESHRRALEAYLTTVSDHGMNASTFTARVVASTESDMISSVVAALGALKGPLHGGAPGPVLDMLDAIGTPDRAVAWLENEMREGRRIMGMGHRIYRVRDPRAAVFEKVLEGLERTGEQQGRLALARAVESAAFGVLRAKYPNRPLHANVEFYTAVLLDTLGIPRQGFTATFAMGRVVGWCAHVNEQRAVGRLIRPASRYVGERHARLA